jgi:hypothetical protein
MAVKPRLSRKGLLLFSFLTNDNGRHGGAEKRLNWFLIPKPHPWNEDFDRYQAAGSFRDHR